MPTKFDFADTATAFEGLNDAELQKAYWLFGMMNKPWLVNIGTTWLSRMLNWGLPLDWTVKATIFAQFCGGEDINECEKVVQKLGQYSIGSILDYSVEGEDTEEAFDACLAELKRVVLKAAGNKDIPFAVFKVTGLVDSTLLTKAQAGQPLSASEQTLLDRGLGRTNELCKLAHDNKVRIFIDAEESWIQDQIDSWALLMMERYNKDFAIVYNTYQMYRHASILNLKEHISVAQQQGYFFGAKIVRGAYMETERRKATEGGYQDPIQPNKKATDLDYDKALMLCLDNIHLVSFCAGTHNEASTKLLALELDNRGLNYSDGRVWFSQLLGMSDNISHSLAKAGYNVVKYVPYGPVRSVVPYLSRRAKENTAIAGQTSREFGLIVTELRRRRQAKSQN
jgi:proline dehydrogenase